VAGIQRGSPADKAGFKPGDVLLEVDGKPVGDVQSMVALIAALERVIPAVSSCVAMTGHRPRCRHRQTAGAAAQLASLRFAKHPGDHDPQFVQQA